MSPQAREHSFDELARGLASGEVSRSKALRLMGAALVGGTLASLLGIGEAAAAPPAPRGCKRDGKKCKESSQCCSGNCEGGTCAVAQCIPFTESCTADTQCCSGICGGILGSVCSPCRPNGSSCAAGEPCCNGSCVNGICCRTVGSTCTTDTECCTGNCFDGAICE